MNGDHAKPPERDDTAPPEFSIPDHDLLRRIGRGA